MYNITEYQGIQIKSPYPTEEEINKVKKEYADKYPNSRFTVYGKFGAIVIYENE